MAEADDAVENAVRFIDCIAALLAKRAPQDTQ